MLIATKFLKNRIVLLLLITINSIYSIKMEGKFEKTIKFVEILNDNFQHPNCDQVLDQLAFFSLTKLLSSCNKPKSEKIYDNNFGNKIDDRKWLVNRLDINYRFKGC